MPMTLPCFDVDDIADRDLALFAFRCRKTFACSDDEELIAVMHMPASRRADAKIDRVAAKIFRLPVADDRWSRPAHRRACPASDWCRRVHRLFRYFVDFGLT